MRNSVCLPDTEYKINDSGKHFSILENPRQNPRVCSNLTKIHKILFRVFPYITPLISAIYNHFLFYYILLNTSPNLLLHLLYCHPIECLLHHLNME